MAARFIDVVRAEFFANLYWMKNNKGLFVAMVVWPYLMVALVMGMGYLLGSPEVYTRRMGISNPALFMLSASVVAMSSVTIIDTVAGYTLYNRWLGTLNYILLTPMKTPKLLIAAGLPTALFGPAVTISSILPAAVYFEGVSGGLKLSFMYAIIIAGMIPLLGISVIAASLLLVVREESNVINSLVPFLLLVSGVFYPVEVLPGVLQAVSEAIPVRYVVDAAKLVNSISTGFGAQLFTILYILAFMGVAYNIIAFLFVGRVDAMAKSRGVD